MKIAPCPLCGSPGVYHAPAHAGLRAMASCSGEANPQCILQECYQDETNRHVRFDEWPRHDWRELEAALCKGTPPDEGRSGFRQIAAAAAKIAGSDAPCVFECRNAEGSTPTAGAGVAWCRTHGFDCPNLRPGRV